MATNKLRDFLLTLVDNPARQDRFKKGGMEPMMKEAGLSAKEKAAVRSRDSSKMRELVGPPSHHKPPILCNAIYGGGPVGGAAAKPDVVVMEL